MLFGYWWKEVVDSEYSFKNLLVCTMYQLPPKPTVYQSLTLVRSPLSQRILLCLSQLISLTSQSISLMLNGTVANPHAPKWSANPHALEWSANPSLLPASQTFQAPLFAPEWCGCTFSFLRCGCTFSFRLSTANCAPSPGKPKFQILLRQSFFSGAAELEPHFTCSEFSFLRVAVSSSRMLDIPPPSSRMVPVPFLLSISFQSVLPFTWKCLLNFSLDTTSILPYSCWIFLLDAAPFIPIHMNLPHKHNHIHSKFIFNLPHKCDPLYFTMNLPHKCNPINSIFILNFPLKKMVFSFFKFSSIW